MSGGEPTARELLDRHIAAWNDRDWATLESLYHPGATIQGPPDWPETGVYTGWNQVRAQYARLRDPWSADRSELVAFDAKGDRAVGRFRWHLRGKDSEIEFSDELSFAFVWRDRRIVEIRYFREHADAVAEFER